MTILTQSADILQVLEIQDSDIEYRGHLFRVWDGKPRKHLIWKDVYIWRLPWRIAKRVILFDLQARGYRYDRTHVMTVLRLAVYGALARTRGYRA